jgi:hypothetical protein
MSTSAQVRSVQLLEHLHAVLARYGVAAQSALATAALEIRRTQNALHDQLKYWQQQVFKREEERAQARSALAHTRAMSEDRRTGCVEQELALRKAEERLRHAEGKVAAVRRWQRELPDLIEEYEGPARALSGLVEPNLRQGLALLETKVASLQAYLALSVPGAAPAPAAPPPQPSEPS